MRQRPANTDDDIHLMLQVKRCDHQAFDELDHKYRPIVRNFLARLKCPTDVLDDLTEEVFARVWEHRRRFRGDSTIKTYLCGIARNVLADELKRLPKQIATSRARSLECRLKRSNGLSEPEANVHIAEITEAMEQAMFQLTAEQRQAVELVHRKGISLQEAAQHAGCLIRAFESRLCRAYRRLRQLLRSMEP